MEQEQAQTQVDELKQIYIYNKICLMIREFSSNNVGKFVKKCSESYFTKKFDNLIKKLEDDKNSEKKINIQKLKELKNEFIGFITYDHNNNDFEGQLISSMIRSIDECVSELIKFPEIANIFYDYTYFYEHGKYPEENKNIKNLEKTTEKKKNYHYSW
jgi:hypothetical protein